MDQDLRTSRIVELRQYTLHPGQRDVLIAVFDEHFVEGQEEVGMAIIGQFRDLDDPNRFVWLRGFADMAQRAKSLTDFYTGPVWHTHRSTANATMVDSDNVLLLRPARASSGFIYRPADRAPRGASALPPGLLVGSVWYFDAPIADDFTAAFERELAPLIRRHGGSVDATLVTDSSLNNFPQLPVRQNEHVFAWFARFPDRAACERHGAALAASREWTDALARHVLARAAKPPETLLLAPTARSQLR